MLNKFKKWFHKSRVKFPVAYDVCALVFGADIIDLDSGIQVNSIKQPVKVNSVGSGYVSHCRTPSFTIILITASVSWNTYNKASRLADWTSEGTEPKSWITSTWSASLDVCCFAQAKRTCLAPSAHKDTKRCGTWLSCEMCDIHKARLLQPCSPGAPPTPKTGCYNFQRAWRPTPCQRPRTSACRPRRSWGSPPRLRGHPAVPVLSRSLLSKWQCPPSLQRVPYGWPCGPLPLFGRPSTVSECQWSRRSVVRPLDWHRASRKKTAWSDHHRKPLFMVLSSQTATSTEVETWFLLPFTRVCLLTTLTFRALHGNHNVMVTHVVYPRLFSTTLTFRADVATFKWESWFLLPFTRACFLTTLTCRALYGKSQCHGQSCRLPALVFDHFDFQNTARESHCVSTIWDHRKMFFHFFLYLPDTLKQFKT